MHNASEHFRIVSYGVPNVVTIELFSGKFMGMLVDASRSPSLCSICTLKVAMLIRRRIALIGEVRGVNEHGLVFKFCRGIVIALLCLLYSSEVGLNPVTRGTA